MPRQQMRPASKEDAPDPAHSYERADPRREGGGLDQPPAPRQRRPDHEDRPRSGRKRASRGVAADDLINRRRSKSPPRAKR